MASRLSQLIEKSQIATTPVATTIPTAGSRLNLLQKEEIIPEIPKAVQIFPSVMQILTELQIDPLSLKEKPEEAIGVAWKTLSETFSKSASELQDFFQIQTKEPVSKEVGEKFKEIAAGGHILFSPISALFEGANKIPVLGSVSRLLSLPFVAVGEGGTKIVRKIIKNIPEQIMPNETKENITEGLEEIFALGSQLVLGKITHITTKKTVELVKRFGEKDAQTIINKSQELAKQAQEPMPTEIIKPEIKPEVKFEKVEPKPLVSEVKPEIVKPIPKEIEPMIKEIEKIDTILDLHTFLSKRAKRFESIEAYQGSEEYKVIKPYLPTEFKIKGIKEVKPEVKPTRKYIEVPREQLPIKMVEAEKGVSVLEARMKGIFETKNIKAAKAEAEVRGMDISVYDKMNKPEQIRQSAKYVSKTPQYEVLKVLEGKQEAPKGLLNNAIMLALEEKSLRDKNVNLAIKLASLRSTRIGQEISILTEVAELRPDIGAMNEIIRARRSFAEKKLKTGEKLSQKKETMKKEIKIEQTKFQLKMSEVEKLLNLITC